MGTGLQAVKKPDAYIGTNGAILALPNDQDFVHLGGYGGYTDTNTAFSVGTWSYNSSTPIVNNAYKSDGTSYDYQHVFNGAAAISRTTGIAYYLGGRSVSSPDTLTNKLVAYDTATHNSSVINTAFPYAGIADSAMVWLPVGEQGILVNIGGVVSNNVANGLNSMERINVYDIAGDAWYTQSTSQGHSDTQPPADRSRICAVTPTVDKNTTHWEIALYGGSDSSNNPIDDIWVLSLPSTPLPLFVCCAVR